MFEDTYKTETTINNLLLKKCKEIAKKDIKIKLLIIY